MLKKYVKNKFRFIAADLDGTLIKDDGSIDYKSLGLIDLLLSEGKIEKFVIASGRHFCDLIEILENIKCSEKVVAICSDGQYIYDAKGNPIYIFGTYVAPQHTEEICSHNNVISVQAVTDEKDYIYFKSPVRRLLHQIKDVVTRNRQNNYIGKQQIKKIDKIEKLIVFCGHEKKSLDMNRETYFVHCLKSGVVEILAVNKLMALKYLETIALINLDETIYFGDDDNDVECFYHIKSGIAMGNAAKTIKSIAKSVTKSNNENGIYYALIDVLKIEEVKL